MGMYVKKGEAEKRSLAEKTFAKYPKPFAKPEYEEIHMGFYVKLLEAARPEHNQILKKNCKVKLWQFLSPLLIAS